MERHERPLVGERRLRGECRISPARLACASALFIVVILMLTRMDAAWAQPHQNGLRDTINTPVPSATFGPTATATEPPGPCVGRVLLQEGHDEYAGTSDTWIYAYLASYPQSLQGGLELRGASIASVLTRFDLAGILPDGAEIIKAELVFFVDVGDETRALETSIYRVLQPWEEAQATWNHTNRVGGTYWQQPGCRAPGVDRAETPDDVITLLNHYVYRGFNVTDSVRHWVEHPDENYGWLIEGALDSTAKFTLGSSRYQEAYIERRPILRIDYNICGEETPTPTATMTPPESTDTPTPTVDATVSPDATPTMTPTYAPGTVHAFVYHDDDRDGQYDTGEYPIAGVSIDLLTQQGGTWQVTDTRLTHQDGGCTFSGLAQGQTVRLQQHNLPGYESTTDDLVQVNLADWVSVSFGDYSSTWVTPTPTATSPAPTQTPTPAGSGILDVSVFGDTNCNALRDPGETGIAGAWAQVLRFIDGAWQIVHEGTTDTQGICRFTGLATGEVYRLIHRPAWGYYPINHDVVQVILAEMGTTTVGYGDCPGGTLALPLIIH